MKDPCRTSVFLFLVKDCHHSSNAKLVQDIAAVPNGEGVLPIEAIATMSIMTLAVWEEEEEKGAPQTSHVELALLEL